MPRSRSLVTALPWLSPSVPPGATHTLRTPSSGAIHASRAPSGEMAGLIRSGFPKRTDLGTSGTSGTLIGVTLPLRCGAPFPDDRRQAVPESAYVLIQTEVG